MCTLMVTNFIFDPIGRRWIKQMFIGAFLIPAMVCGTAFFINFIAMYYHASRAIPFGTMVSLECRRPLPPLSQHLPKQLANVLS